MGTIARSGDPNYAGAPSWSHDGTTIVYVSTNANVDGRLDDGAAHLDRALQREGRRQRGGSRRRKRERDEKLYPAFSPDDKWVVFDEVASGSMYNNATDELYVVPAKGGTATRLDAKTPRVQRHDESRRHQQLAQVGADARHDAGRAHLLLGRLQLDPRPGR